MVVVVGSRAARRGAASRSRRAERRTLARVVSVRRNSRRRADERARARIAARGSRRAPVRDANAPSRTRRREREEMSADANALGRATSQRLTRSSMPLMLFYCTEMEQMAREIAAIDGNIELGEIQWRTFADGFPNIFVNDAEQLHGRHVAFLASFHNASVIFQQLSVIYSLPKMFVASFRLILPFFPTGTFERVDKEGEIPTAVTMARMLSSIPHSRGGPTDMIVFDIHALQERFYFGDSVTPLFASGIPLLLERLASLEDAADVVIAYPDEGACKRFHNFFAKYDEVVCTKVREGDKRIVTIKEGKPTGKHIVIVDDLVQSGGTLIECAKVLRREGASAVSAYVTHGVFPNESWRRFTDPSAGFANFWITDSCPQTVSACSGVAPFVVLKLAGSVAHALNI